MPTVEVHSPLHPGQAQVLAETRRFNVLAAGRRWGKSQLAKELLAIPALAGYPTACFQPTTKLLSEFWRDITSALRPVTTRKTEDEHRLELHGGGSIDCWSLESEGAGRGRRYKTLVVDEAGLHNRLEDVWNNDLRPTLTDYSGSAWFIGTPNGRNGLWALHQRGQSPNPGDWKSWTFPSSSNPFLPDGEVEAARLDMPERAFAQEFLALFISDSGAVFKNITPAIDRGRTETSIITDFDLQFGMGVDVAKRQDFTVITILTSKGEQAYFDRFNWVSWPNVTERIIHAYGALATLAVQPYVRNKPPRKLNAPSVILDRGGIGDYVFDELVKSGIYVIPYQPTNASNIRMVDQLAAGFDAGKLRLMDHPDQEAELLAFEITKTGTGMPKYCHPPGGHDDTVWRSLWPTGASTGEDSGVLGAFEPRATGPGSGRN